MLFRSPSASSRSCSAASRSAGKTKTSPRTRAHRANSLADAQYSGAPRHSRNCFATPPVASHSRNPCPAARIIAQISIACLIARQSRLFPVPYTVEYFVFTIRIASPKAWFRLASGGSAAAPGLRLTLKKEPCLPTREARLGESDCKPGSVPLRAAVIPLGAWLPMPSSNLPGSVWPGRPASLFGLASDGACQARHVAVPAGRLLPHRFTLTLPARRNRAVCFLWRFPRVTPPGNCPASCPVKPGLSSPSGRPAACAARLPHTRRQPVRLPKYHACVASSGSAEPDAAPAPSAGASSQVLPVPASKCSLQ